MVYADGGKASDTLQRRRGDVILGICFEKDLAKAELYCCHGISELNKKKPAYPFAANEEWVGWLHNYGELNILLGTVYAYMRKTTRSVYYFMRALNTEALNLNMPYCDFIRYMISKLDDEPCSSADYTGRGFCAEEPMGFLPSKDAFLYAGAALEIIPGLAGLDGEVIVARKCNTSMPYGSMRRYSVADPHQPHMIDVYEVYVIDKQFNLKKASFHFNGYMPHSDRRSIILPDGFTVRQNSPLHKTYTLSNRNSKPRLSADFCISDSLTLKINIIKCCFVLKCDEAG